MTAPAGAHGRRSDGTYFSVWKCPENHAQVGTVEAPPSRCASCGSTEWERCSIEEAYVFVGEIGGREGVGGMLGFELL